ncbi:SWIM zinc finger family protein [Maribacter sp. BPC-D8]|uniref:SWIM zinc finger family protein n=1 Tax=Maribacter sp. BPC-D8 TaxID=3053613 RepID=UPI002B47121E|nr:SWIM zinc finger family protein [Maribacter sp. BPC-D8]WRI30206.1 SWIM zinc finger family protein [Maribacter sp. BPC-D8]
MDISYQYCQVSSLKKTEKESRLFLAHFNEEYSQAETPCFFWGKLNNPYLVARSLLTLSKVVAANYMPLGSSLRDPVITAGGNKLRLEAFSSCCSVYAKVDLLPASLEGDFLQQGTTNVDFNTEMISALSKIRKNEEVFFSIGEKDFVLQKDNNSVVEKKVSLPLRWIKGMATVQVLASELTPFLKLDKLQIQLLFRSVPKGNINDDYYLSLRGRRPNLSPVKSPKSICIGGVHRLRLLDGLVNLADSLTIYAMETENATAFEFQMKNMRFTLMLSRSFWRGFSGEGTVLSHLVDDVPDTWLDKLDNYAKIHEEFSLKDNHLQELSTTDFKNVATRLASMGLLGFDLTDQVYYYRKLPFKMNRIESLNPRYKNALKIIKKGDYKWLVKNKEIEVKGSGHYHKIVLSKEKSKCTCTWYASHQNERGDCKHILVGKILKNKEQTEIEKIIEELEL